MRLCGPHQPGVVGGDRDLEAIAHAELAAEILLK
jgi:hypothetical protein